MTTKNESTQKYVSNPFKLTFRGLGDLFKYNQTMAVIILVVTALSSFGQFNYSGGGSTSSSQPATTGPHDYSVLFIIIGIVLIFAVPLIVFLGTLYTGIVAYTALQTSKRQTITFKQALRATMSKFWTLLWINIIVFFKVLGGALLFIIPGVRAALRYNMVHFHVFDENANAKQAIAKSKALTKDHLIEVFGMTTVGSIIPVVGQILVVGGQTIMYPQLTELKASGAEKPPVHWLNYIAFVIVGGGLLIGLLIALLVALALAK